MKSNFVPVLGELYSAGFAATANFDLGLDDNGVPDSFRYRYRLIDGVGDITGGYRYAKSREVLLALILK